jgi:hypothetical protein
MTTNTRIDNAVKHCVRSALGGPKTPLAALATSLDELRGDSSWTTRDIERVREIAYNRLAFVIPEVRGCNNLQYDC